MQEQREPVSQPAGRPAFGDVCPAYSQYFTVFPAPLRFLPLEISSFVVRIRTRKEKKDGNY